VRLPIFGVEPGSLIEHLDQHPVRVEFDVKPDGALRTDTRVLHRVRHQLAHDELQVLSDPGIEGEFSQGTPGLIRC
jgi:hypothetical protein